MSLWGRLIARMSREDRQVNRGESSVRGRTAAGVPMSPELARENASFWAAHRYLTQTLGQLPARVMRMNGKNSERVTSHPVDSVLTWRANPELSPFQLKETLTGWAISRGNGVAEIETDAVGRVVNLWPIHPTRVDFVRDTATDALIYRIANGAGGTVDLAPEQVFHIRGYGDGPVGLSVVAYAAQSLGWARATELFGATFFGESLNPAGFIESPRPMDSKAKDKLRVEVDQLHKGPRRSNRWAILDGGMKWTKLSTQPDEAQFLETLQFQVEEVCRWMNVPPQKIYHLLRMTFNNVEQLAIETVVDSIAPWCVRWEEECNFKLFGKNRAGFFVKLDLKGLLRGAFKERQEGLQVMRRNGIVNADEWRELEDLGPMGGAAGKKFIVEGNMTTLDKVGETPPAPAAAPVPPPDPAQDPASDPAAAQALNRAAALLEEMVDA
jgi:HK97 family phage portal protein